MVRPRTGPCGEGPDVSGVPQRLWSAQHRSTRILRREGKVRRSDMVKGPPYWLRDLRHGPASGCLRPGTCGVEDTDEDRGVRGSWTGRDPYDTPPRRSRTLLLPFPPGTVELDTPRETPLPPRRPRLWLSPSPDCPNGPRRKREPPRIPRHSDRLDTSSVPVHPSRGPP